MANTFKGRRLYVCATPQPSDLTQYQYDLLSWVEVKHVGSIGEMGTSTGVVSYDELATDVSQKQKAVSNAGDPQIDLARDPADAGQAILRAAGATKYNYAFKIEDSDAPSPGQGVTVYYNRGVVAGPTRPGGRNQDFILERYVIGLNQAEIVVTLPFNVFIDSVNGSDTNDGTSPAKAYKTVAAAGLNTKPLTRGVGFAAGGEYILDSFLPMNGGASASAPIYIGSFGTGPKPVLHNALKFTAGAWTNVSGSIYSAPTTSTFNGNNIWWAAGSVITILKKGTAGALTANQWVITGGVLQVNIGRAPNAFDVFNIPRNTNGSLVLNARNNVIVQDLSFRFCGSSIVEIANALAVDNALFQRCEFAYANGGLIHAGAGAAATKIVADNCWFHDQANLQNAFSLHCDFAAGNGEVRNCLFERIAGWAATCHDTATLLCYNNVCNGGYFFIIGGGAGGPGIHTFIRNRQYNQRPEAVASDYFFSLDANVPLAAATVVNVYHHSIAAGTMPVQQRMFNHGSGTLTIKNFLFYGGFSIAFNGSNVNGSRTTQCIAGSIFGTELFNWYVGGSSGALNGPGDVPTGTTSPYNNVATGDLTLKLISPGSLVRGTGTFIPGVSAIPVDIGYTGAL